jgi:protocatechuate 3,4-dioxygenase beta subunit
VACRGSPSGCRPGDALQSRNRGRPAARHRQRPGRRQRQALSPAHGTVTQLGGRILDARGEPIRNALIEIWQVDHHGVYLHRDSNRHDERDTHFQGFGRFLTGSSGDYCFRTIKPVSYPGRTPHIHFAVKLRGREKWITQCYVKGERHNATDGVLRSIPDRRRRESVIADFVPIKKSSTGELAARFDIVMGFTPGG